MGSVEQESTPAADEGSQEQLSTEGQEPAVKDEKAGQEPERVYDEATVKKLRREAAEARTRANKAETQLQEIADEQKSEQERLAEKAEEAEKTAAEATARLIRYEVASAHGLDLKAAEFLTGSTREEIEERAGELVKLIADRPKAGGSGFDGGARQPAKEKKSPEEEHNLLLLRAAGREPQ